MVSTIKRWLGIDALERENLILAKAFKAQGERIGILELETAILRHDLQELSRDSGKELTPAPVKPKIVSKPMKKAVNWKSFRSAAEKASEPQEQE